LIFTGIMMQFTGPDSRLMIVFFPGAVKLHDICAVILTVNYIVFVVGNIVSGNGKYYRISKKDIFPGLAKQLKYFFWGIFRKEKNPFQATIENKFNPMQKVTYIIIMYILIPLLILSGIFMFLPDMILISKFGTGIYIFIDTVHIMLAALVSIFLIIHIYLCTTGSTPGSHFRAIISGYQESEE
jgi:thiosulfate reductase cytochrome b subunit